jgi:hypothetical protein
MLLRSESFLLISCLVYYSSTLNMEVCSSETSADFHRTTRRYIPKDITLPNQNPSMCSEVITCTHIVTILVTINGVWNGNRIYWTLTTLTTSNYNHCTNLHALPFTRAHIYVFAACCVFTSHCLAAASTTDVLFFWVPELSPASATTAHHNCATAVL